MAVIVVDRCINGEFYLLFTACLATFVVAFNTDYLLRAARKYSASFFFSLVARAVKYAVFYVPQVHYQICQSDFLLLWLLLARCFGCARVMSSATHAWVLLRLDLHELTLESVVCAMHPTVHRHSAGWIFKKIPRSCCAHTHIPVCCIDASRTKPIWRYRY